MVVGGVAACCGPAGVSYPPSRTPSVTRAQREHQAIGVRSSEG